MDTLIARLGVTIRYETSEKAVGGIIFVVDKQGYEESKSNSLKVKDYRKSVSFLQGCRDFDIEQNGG